jgi:hypothetical protein
MDQLLEIVMSNRFAFVVLFVIPTVLGHVLAKGVSL